MFLKFKHAYMTQYVNIWISMLCINSFFHYFLTINDHLLIRSYMYDMYDLWCEYQMSPIISVCWTGNFLKCGLFFSWDLNSTLLPLYFRICYNGLCYYLTFIMLLKIIKTIHFLVVNYVTMWPIMWSPKQLRNMIYYIM